MIATAHIGRAARPTRRVPSAPLLVGLAAATLLGAGARAFAADTPQGILLGPFALLPAVGVEAGYDDNILLQANDPIGDEVFRGVGRIDLRLPRPMSEAARPALPPPDSDRPIVSGTM